MASSKVSQGTRAPKRATSQRPKAIRQVTVVHECLALAVGAIGEAVGIFEAAVPGDEPRRRALQLLRNAQSIVKCEMGGAL